MESKSKRKNDQVQNAFARGSLCPVHKKFENLRLVAATIPTHIGVYVFSKKSNRACFENLLAPSPGSMENKCLWLACLKYNK